MSARRSCCSRCAALIVAITVRLLLVLGVVPENDKGTRDSTAMLAWKSLMHTMDAGTLGGDAGSWTFLLVFLFATIGGLFVVSALIGVLNQGFGTMLDQLRRGKSVVVENESHRSSSAGARRCSRCCTSSPRRIATSATRAS